MNRFEPLPNMACEITPELEQRIKDVNNEAHALHLAVMPTLYVGAQVRDANGNITFDGKYKANSFNRNFYNFLVIFLIGTQNYSLSDEHGEGKVTIIGYNGAIHAANYAELTFGGIKKGSAISASIALDLMTTNANRGILIGTSASAEDFNGFYLDARISNGTATGQMVHLIPTADSVTPQYDPVNKTYSCTYYRIFKNQSGVEIIVRETGLYGYDFLFERTVLPIPVSVPSGSLIEVSYKIVFHFPEPAS
jgi:hypothetical protein